MNTDKPQNLESQAAKEGRLLARPKPPILMGKLGLQPLGLNSQRDGWLLVPKSYRASHPAPLVVMLHGARSNARRELATFKHMAEAFGLLLLAIDSRGSTWDIILDRYGPDIAFIDTALEQTLARYAVDPARIAIEGFSDGASYALSVGITNGDLFTHVIAFSPGFMTAAAHRGLPRLFISHGKWDTYIPINACSRKIVPQLRQAGYDVLYREFYGFHMVPRVIARSALAWFMAERE